ncbi:hypothetical protein JW933_05580 [candidate division FCPU426 bacterium]|nr:hypothetical protein [candidate division FCPU426 bacterium]
MKKLLSLLLVVLFGGSMLMVAGCAPKQAEQAAPAMEEAAPAMDEAAPAGEEAVPAGEEAAPAEQAPETE